MKSALDKIERAIRSAVHSNTKLDINDIRFNDGELFWILTGKSYVPRSSGLGMPIPRRENA